MSQKHSVSDPIQTTRTQQRYLHRGHFFSFPVCCRSDGYGFCLAAHKWLHGRYCLLVDFQSSIRVCQDKLHGAMRPTISTTSAKHPPCPTNVQGLRHFGNILHVLVTPM